MVITRLTAQSQNSSSSIVVDKPPSRTSAADERSQVGGPSGHHVDVDHGTDVRPYTVARPRVAVGEMHPADVRQRVESSLRGGARVVGLEILVHFGVEGGFDECAAGAVAVRFEVERIVHGVGDVTAAAFVSGFVSSGAAVTVDRVGETPHHCTELVRCRHTRELHDLGLDTGDLRFAPGRVRAGYHGRVPGRDLAPPERLRHHRQRFELAGQLDMPARNGPRHAARATNRRRRVQVSVGAPVAGTVVRGDDFQPRRLGRVELPPHLRQLIKPLEHVFYSTRKHTENKGESRPPTNNSVPPNTPIRHTPFVPRPTIRAPRSDELELMRDIEWAAGVLFDDIEGLAAVSAAEPATAAQLGEYARAGRAWVATIDDRPVGYAIVDVIDGLAHLEQLSVVPTTGARDSVARSSNTSGTGLTSMDTRR